MLYSVECEAGYSQYIALYIRPALVPGAQAHVHYSPATMRGGKKKED